MIRRITVELAFPGESIWTDVSGLVRYPSWNIDEAAFSSEKRSAVDKFSCNLKYDATILGKLRAADARIWIRVKNALDASALFFGVVEPSVANETSDHVGEISLEAVDNSWRLDEKVSTTRQLPALVASSGYKLWDPTDPTHSIAHVMLADAGYSTAEISAAISNTIVIKSFSAIKDESTYRELLDVLFTEYGYVIHPDESGVLTLLPWKPTTTAIELGPDDLSTVVPFKFENRADYRDSAKVTWAELEILYGVLVYRADLPVDSDGNFTGEAIASADFYPKDSDIEDIYQTYVQKWLDKPYLARETRLANKDLTLVATSGATISFEADDGIAVDINLFESHQARVRFLNSATTTGKIRIFEIYADALVRKKIGTEKALPLGTETNAREYASQYLFDKTSAQALATALAEDLYAEEQYSFGCNQVLGLGSRVKLIEARNGTSVHAVITRRKRSSAKAYIEYEAIQLLTVAGITVTSQSQTMSKVWPQASEKVTPEQPLSTKILAHRSYDEVDLSGTLVLDNSGAGHHAVRSGGTVVNGIRGRGLALTEADTVAVDYGEQDLSQGWSILKTMSILSSNPAHAAYGSKLDIELWLPDGTIRTYTIAGIPVATGIFAGVVHNATEAQIWYGKERYASYVCGPGDIARVVMRLVPHEAIAAEVQTIVDDETDAARALTALEIAGYVDLGMTSKYTWADHLNKLAAEGTITPQDKTAIDLWFSEISGSYETLRDAAIAVEVPITDLDIAYEAIASYLYSSPGILVESAWADPIYIMVSDWAQIKSAFASVVAVVTTAISEAQAAAAAAQAVKTIAPVFKGRVAYDDLSVTAGNDYDTIVAYSTTIADCGIYRRESGAWVDKTAPTAEMVTAAWFDILWALNNGFPDSGTDTEKLQAYIGSGTRFSTMQAYNVILANMIKTVNGFFENIMVSGRATLSELVLAGVAAGDNVVHYHAEILATASIYSYDEAWRYTPPVSGVIRISGHYWAYQAGVAYLGIGHSDSTLVYETSGSAPPLQALPFSYDATVEENVSISIFIKKADDGSLAVRLNEIYVKIAENPGILRFISPPEVLL